MKKNVFITPEELLYLLCFGELGTKEDKCRNCIVLADGSKLTFYKEDEDIHFLYSNGNINYEHIEADVVRYLQYPFDGLKELPNYPLCLGDIVLVLCYCLNQEISEIVAKAA